MNKEKVTIILIGLGILFLVNLPLLYFYLFPKEGLIFLGRRVINSQDIYTYVSLIEEAKQGKVLLDDLYTSQNQVPSLVRPSYLLLGKMASIFSISSIEIYHLSRIILSLVFLAILYKFISLFFESPKKRIFAYTLLLTSSGIGFIASILMTQSSDLWIPESNTFMTLAEAPHFILSQILMISGFMLFLKFLEAKKPVYILISTLLFLFLSFEHPYNLFIVSIVIFFTSFLSGISVIESFTLATLSSFGIIYQVWQVLTNPIVKLWKVNALSPSPSAYLSGFGLLIPLSIIGMERFLNEKRKEYKLVIIWIMAVLLLIYAPFDSQRRVIEGVHIPLSILACVGIFYISEKLKKTYRLWFMYILLFLLALSSFYLIINDINTIQKESIRGYYYYLTASEFSALNWLKNNTTEKDVVLSNWFYGNIIPGITGRKVYLGHWAQSGGLDEKIKLINTFLLDQNVISSVSFLKQNNITYIFLGNYDSMLSYGFKPDSKPFLTKVYSKNGVLIYKVNYNFNKYFIPTNFPLH